MTIHLSILLFAPLVLAFAGALLPGRAALYLAFAGTLVSLVLAVVMIFDFDHSKDGLQYVTDAQWITSLGIRYKLGIDGLNLWLVGLSTLLFAASSLWVLVRPVARPAQFAFHLALALSLIHI